MKRVSFQLAGSGANPTRHVAIADAHSGLAIVASEPTAELLRVLERESPKLGPDADERALRRLFTAVDHHVRATRAEHELPCIVMASVYRARRIAHLIHLGDTRAYLLRQNPVVPRPGTPAPEFSPEVTLADGSTLTCLTYDQTPACELVELGMMSRAEGRLRARRRVLTHYLGSTPPSEPDVFSIDVVAGDRLLLCTPELWLEVDDPQLVQLLRGEELPEELFARLAARAGTTAAELPLVTIDCVLASGDARTARQPNGVGTGVMPEVFDAEVEPLPRHSVLAELGRDVNEWTKHRPPASFAGRDELLRELMRSLMRLRKANVLLVGDPGVGKTWLVEALAARMNAGHCPPALQRKRVVEISMGALLSGTRYRGDFEARIQSILDEVAADPSVILFIDELHLAMQSGSSSEGSMDAANLLKPALARGDLRLIGATTTREFDRYIARDEAFLRRFEVVRVDEPSTADTRAILRRLAAELEEHHGMTVSDEAVTAAIELSVRHLTDRRLPDKAIDLLDQACTRAASRWLSMTFTGVSNSNAAGSSVERIDVAAVVARRCGVPLDLVLLDEAQRLANLDRLLGERVLGQEAAVRAVAETIRNSYAGLKHPERPVASLLLVGPTGVGKTALARAVAELVLGADAALLRLDMSEYMEKHAVARLLGAAPGYVGHDQGGQLSAALRARPGSVVLFDEIEKAHPDVLQLLLQILDHGRLRDARGDDLSFRDTIVVLTSNLEVTPRQREVGFGRGKPSAPGGAGTEQAAREQLQRSLRPELIGRLSRVVVFEALAAEALAQIADKQLQGLLERVLDGELDAAPPRSLRRAIHDQLAVTPFGARDIERLVEQEVGRWLSTRRRSGADIPLTPGTIVIDRLPSGRRTQAALMHVEYITDLSTPRAEIEREVRALVDELVGSAAGIEVRHLQYAARGVLACFGGVLAATELADRLDPRWRCVIHWGRIDRDATGHLSGSAVDHLLELARNSDEPRHLTAEARDQLTSPA